MRYTLYLLLLLVFFFGYVGCVASKYKPVDVGTTTSEYTPERVKDAEVPDVPELTPEEKQEVQEEIKQTYKEIEETLDVEKKSVEQMREDVEKILDEIIEEDSTVTISFNMTTKNPSYFSEN